MIGPFVLMPMCDCVVDKKTKKKVCKPFLRSFVLDCNGLRVNGDYDYNAKPYKPEGEVSSEAKCCDCSDCGCSKTKSKACYDLKCLLRREELNGGLTNLQITGADGVAGSVVVFNPPVNDVKSVFERLNAIKYLGFDSWTSSGNGLLCVEFEKGVKPPGALTSCRFRRYSISGSQNSWLPISWYGSGNSTGFTTCADNYAILDPSVTAASLGASNIHYLCNVRYTDSYSSTQSTLAVGNMTNDRIFRTTFNSRSQHHYVHLSPGPGTTDVLSGTNIAVGFANSVAAFPSWLESVFTQQGIASNVAVSQTTAPVTQSDATVVRFNVNVDLPCRYELNTMNNVIATNGMEVTAAGGLVNLGAASNHLYTFTHIVGVGGFVATPAVDGVGGGTNLNKDCNEESPGGELSEGRLGDDHIA